MDISGAEVATGDKEGGGSGDFALAKGFAGFFLADEIGDANGEEVFGGEEGISAAVHGAGGDGEAIDGFDGAFEGGVCVGGGGEFVGSVGLKVLGDEIGGFDGEVGFVGVVFEG